VYLFEFCIDLRIFASENTNIISLKLFVIFSKGLLEVDTELVKNWRQGRRHRQLPPERTLTAALFVCPKRPAKNCLASSLPVGTTHFAQVAWRNCSR